MTLQTQLLAVVVTSLTGAGILCPLCEEGVRGAAAEPVAVAQAPDTATVRLHISKMTCGSCPVTARLALTRIPGVLGATVTLDDSLGIVRYDPRKVTPAVIARELTRQTGYPARVLTDSGKQTRRAGE